MKKVAVMTPSDDHRQLVDEILAEALELPGLARNEYLNRVCAGDASLRAEVDSLLGHAPSPEILDPTVTMRGLHPSEVIDNRWRIVSHIGSGAMGDVYEAEDTLMRNRRVALKAIRPDAAMDPRMRIRFEQEVRIAQQVTHDNVCRVYDMGLHRLKPDGGELLYLTMQLLLPGATLA